MGSVPAVTYTPGFASGLFFGLILGIVLVCTWVMAQAKKWPHKKEDRCADCHLRPSGLRFTDGNIVMEYRDGRIETWRYEIEETKKGAATHGELR